jgi:hypothetical protein
VVDYAFHWSCYCLPIAQNCLQIIWYHFCQLIRPDSHPPQPRVGPTVSCRRTLLCPENFSDTFGNCLLSSSRTVVVLCNFLQLKIKNRYIGIYIYMCVCMCAYVRECMCVYVYIYIYIRVCVCLCICTCVHVYVCVSVCTQSSCFV